MEATHNVTVTQLSVRYLAQNDLDDGSPTLAETQFVNAGVTLGGLSVMTVGGISPSLSHV